MSEKWDLRFIQRRDSFNKCSFVDCSCTYRPYLFFKNKPVIKILKVFHKGIKSKSIPRISQNAHPASNYTKDANMRHAAAVRDITKRPLTSAGKSILYMDTCITQRFSPRRLRIWTTSVSSLLFPACIKPFFHIYLPLTLPYIVYTVVCNSQLLDDSAVVVAIPNRD